MKAKSNLMLLGLSILFLTLSGCGGIEKRVEEKAEAKLAAWQVAPPGEQPTQEIIKAMWEESKVEIYQEISEKGQGIVSSILTGNWIASAFYALGLAGIFFGVRGKTSKPASP